MDFLKWNKRIKKYFEKLKLQFINYLTFVFVSLVIFNKQIKIIIRCKVFILFFAEP